MFLAASVRLAGHMESGAAEEAVEAGPTEVGPTGTALAAMKPTDETSMGPTGDVGVEPIEDAEPEPEAQDQDVSPRSKLGALAPAPAPGSGSGSDPVGNLEKMKETRKFYNELVTEYTEVHGAQHTFTLRAKLSLATLLKDTGGAAEARDLYTEAIAGFTQQFGAQHTRTLEAQFGLALVLAELGAFAEAHTLYEQVLEGRTATLGADHPMTVETKKVARNFRAA